MAHSDQRVCCCPTLDSSPLPRHDGHLSNAWQLFIHRGILSGIGGLLIEVGSCMPKVCVLSCYCLHCCPICNAPPPGPVKLTWTDATCERSTAVQEHNRLATLLCVLELNTICASTAAPSTNTAPTHSTQHPAPTHSTQSQTEPRCCSRHHLQSVLHTAAGHRTKPDPTSGVTAESRNN
jgi:hypothetical protein